MTPLKAFAAVALLTAGFIKGGLVGGVAYFFYLMARVYGA